MRITQALSITEPCVELLEGHAAAPGGKILEQNLNAPVQALDIRCVPEIRTTARHELRGMQHELHMSCTISPCSARHLQHCVELALRRVHPADPRRQPVDNSAQQRGAIRPARPPVEAAKAGCHRYLQQGAIRRY